MLNWWVLTMHWQSLPKTFKTHWPAGLVVCLKVLALLKKITDPTFFIARVTLHWKYVLHKKLKNTHQYQSLLSLIYDKVERQCKHLKNILHVSVSYIKKISISPSDFIFYFHWVVLKIHRPWSSDHSVFVKTALICLYLFIFIQNPAQDSECITSKNNNFQTRKA